MYQIRRPWKKKVRAREPPFTKVEGSWLRVEGNDAPSSPSTPTAELTTAPLSGRIPAERTVKGNRNVPATPAESAAPSQKRSSVLFARFMGILAPLVFLLGLMLVLTFAAPNFASRENIKQIAVQAA